VRAGVLAANEVDALEALRGHNPLLFDLALKRRAAWRGARLSASVFQTRDRVVDPKGTEPEVAPRDTKG
jgi:uncharacterized protein